MGMKISGEYDMVRINAAHNGYVISARKRGEKPQSYAYTDQFVARTWDEVVEVLKGIRMAD